MPPSARLSEDIREIRDRFFGDPVGFRAEIVLAGRLDAAILDQWKGSPAPSGFAVFAVGGYGRQTLHPQSDLDLLLFFAGEIDEDVVRSLLSPIWGLGFRVGHQVRQTSDFEDFDPDQIESYTAFLDCRFLFGDRLAAREFTGKLMPELLERHRKSFLNALVRLKAGRRQSYGDSVFQLEPDLKMAPGGLRDYQWIRWMERVLHRNHDPAIDPSVLLLYRIRNFLHFMSGRDQNVLGYEYQDRIAARLGYFDSGEGSAAERLMRDYFLCAQDVALRARTLEERVVGARRCLRTSLEVRTLSDCIEVFGQAHREKLPLDAATLDSIRTSVQHASGEETSIPEYSRRILEMMRDRQGITGVLRAMHQVGLLGKMFPEFEAIRCRVIRDYFHRYTVDEHSLIAIGNIEQLDRDTESDPTGRLQRVLRELEQPELLLLALLLHDVGKAFRPVAGDHVRASVEILGRVSERLSLPTLQRARIRRVVGNHLEMSKILMRRDLTDPGVVKHLAGLVGTQEDLRMLYLLTYADMGAVGSGVWTSWKSDLLWQLYLATFEYLRHGFIEDRVGGQTTDAEITALAHLLEVRGLSADHLGFLDGFPKQYLKNTPPERLADLVRRFLELSEDRPVVTDWSHRDGRWEVLVISADRPELFARLTGVLAAFGMSVVRADVFSNRNGIALDLVTFEDPEMTLTRNPTELERLDGVLKDVVTGVLGVDGLLRRRSTSVVYKTDTPAEPIQITFDRSSTRCTIVEVVATDSIGLLFNIARVVSNLGCNIEVALVATEGQRAIDVFYLTQGGDPLTTEMEMRLETGLKKALERSV